MLLYYGHMNTNRNRGFTLIELLVVIAIIGILSAVVLASLSTARQKGQDASIQSDLATVQTQAEIYYGNNGNTYAPGGNVTWTNGTGPTGTAALCTGGMFSDANIKNAIAGAYTSSGSTAGNVGCAAGTIGVSSAIAYIAAVKLTASTTGAYWCVDSTGVARIESGPVPTSLPTNAACP